MKVWTSEHTFQSPWSTVITAALLYKYPNPNNPNVTGLDVIDRKVEKNGVLKTHRLMQTAFGVPDVIKPFLGMSKFCYVSEHSEVDRRKKTMTLKSRNVTFCNYLTIDEVLVYSVHQEDSQKTQLKQETVLGIKGIPMSSYFEDVVKNNMLANAHKGRQAVEWVIDNIMEETKQITRSAEAQMDTLKHTLLDGAKNTSSSSL